MPDFCHPVFIEQHACQSSRLTSQRSRLPRFCSCKQSSAGDQRGPMTHFEPGQRSASCRGSHHGSPCPTDRWLRPGYCAGQQPAGCESLVVPKNSTFSISERAARCAWLAPSRWPIRSVITATAVRSDTYCYGGVEPDVWRQRPPKASAGTPNSISGSTVYQRRREHPSI